MSGTEEHVKSLREAYRLWHETKGGSAEHWLGLLDEDVDFRSLANGAGRLDFTSHRTNRDGVAAYLDGLLQQFEMIHFTLDDFVAEDNKVVAICTTAWRCRATGKQFETPKVDVWRFRDGKAVAFMEYFDTAAVQAATLADAEDGGERRASGSAM